jgi:hypothetical protein
VQTFRPKLSEAKNCYCNYICSRSNVADPECPVTLKLKNKVKISGNQVR